MASEALEILGLSLSILGWVGVILACGLPMWQVSAFIENNIVVAQTIWEGLWMSCVVQSTGQMQCKVYDSILALRPELQAGRALTVLASIVGLIGLLVTVVGAQCTTCFQGSSIKNRVVLAGGIIYLVCGVLVLIPLCWIANIVIREFFDPMVHVSKKREMGAACMWGGLQLPCCSSEASCCAPPASSMGKAACP
uniref:Claudin n=1 Tax=Leptobrachium leishanense TaxID=445787 RepID=A0A8C5MFX0_9ANUR